MRDYIRKGIEEGATLVTGGEKLPHGIDSGYYVRPTVFSYVSNDMTIAREEIFGPVLSIIPYEDEEDAVRIANDTPYGLAGAVWSGDLERAKKVGRRSRPVKSPSMARRGIAAPLSVVTSNRGSVAREADMAFMNSSK